jgi:hypothetical protein
VVLLDLKSSILREVSVCPRGPKAFLFRLAKLFLEARNPSIPTKRTTISHLKSLNTKMTTPSADQDTGLRQAQKYDGVKQVSEDLKLTLVLKT